MRIDKRAISQENMIEGLPETTEGESGDHVREAVYYVPIDKIRVSEKQQRKISRDKVEKHKKWLADHPDEDLLPIDAHELEDGTFIIDGNGRHRYFAYLEDGYTRIPLNIKQREGFQPTKTS